MTRESHLEKRKKSYWHGKKREEVTRRGGSGGGGEDVWSLDVCQEGGRRWITGCGEGQASSDSFGLGLQKGMKGPAFPSSLLRSSHQQCLDPLSVPPLLSRCHFTLCVCVCVCLVFGQHDGQFLSLFPFLPLSGLSCSNLTVCVCMCVCELCSPKVFPSLVSCVCTGVILCYQEGKRLRLLLRMSCSSLFFCLPSPSRDGSPFLRFPDFAAFLHFFHMSDDAHTLTDSGSESKK